MSTQSPISRKHRRASAVIAVLVCILIITMLGTTLTKEMVGQYRQSKTLQQQSQAFWIAESALHRAVHKLKQADEYRGETWTISPEILNTDYSARAVITVKRVTSPKTGYEVRVAAYCPDTKRTRIMVQRETFVSVPVKKPL